MSIVAFVSDDPLNVTLDPENYVEGEPKFMGAILKNPGEELFNEWYNNHHHMLEFNGKYYIMYHTTALDQFLYKDFYAAANRQSLSYRNMHIDEIKVDVAGENPTIQIQPTYEGPEQTSYFNPYQEINATTQSHQGGLTRKIMDDGTVVLDKINTGDWTRIDGVDFGSKGANKLEASILSKTTEGSVEVYIDEALTGTKIATINLDNTGDNLETVSAALDNITGVHDVYFVFRGEGYNVSSWKFTENTAAPDNPSGGKPPVTSTSAPQQSVGTGKTERGANVIKVGKPAVKSLKNTKNKKVTVTLKKAVKNVDGYEIRYSIKNNMKSSKTVTIKKASTLKTVIKGLKKKTYYVQARAYKKFDGKTYCCPSN